MRCQICFMNDADAIIPMDVSCRASFIYVCMSCYQHVISEDFTSGKSKEVKP
jgi:ribosome-binding protein aMBF1 (putative translation factor)